MSQENVEIVKGSFEAWNAGDMDAFRNLLDPDVILRNPEGWPEPGPFVGREAVMRQWEEQREIWDADAVEPISDFIESADRVVVRFIWHGAGHGPESNMKMTGVFTVRKARMFHAEFFWDHAEALEAVGLSEQDALESSSNVLLRLGVMGRLTALSGVGVTAIWCPAAGPIPLDRPELGDRCAMLSQP